MNRSRAIQAASLIAVIGNAVLAAMKITAGILTGSMAVLGDGIDSSSDILASLITLTAARVIDRPPDMNHPYGHGKAEAVASTLLAFIIFFIGGQLAIVSVQRFITGEPVEIMTLPAVIVTVVSIIGKIFLALVQTRTGRRHESSMLIANGRNMQNDVLLSLGVLGGLAGTWFLGMPVIDTILGCAIGLWVMKTAVEIFIESNRELMDGIKETDIYRTIFEAVRQTEGAHNPHRTRVRRMSQHYLIDLDIEVDGTLTVEEGHRIAQETERAIRQCLPSVYDIVVHVEPLGNDERRERFGVSEDHIDQC
jgi:cation diffusion facilitator family transporter